MAVHRGAVWGVVGRGESWWGMVRDVERMQTSLDEQEAELVRKLADQERRSESSMLRLLVTESLDRRSAGGDGGWAAAARRAPAMRDDAVRVSSARDHEFRAQRGNALKCDECGGKKGEHRG